MLKTKGNRIKYFGHSTFSLTAPSGQVALVDPWVMTNPFCPDALKKVARLDAIFLTHGPHGRLAGAGQAAPAKDCGDFRNVPVDRGPRVCGADLSDAQGRIRKRWAISN